MAPDRLGWSRSEIRAGVQHAQGTRGRGLRKHRIHAFLLGSSDDFLLINASAAIRNCHAAAPLDEPAPANFATHGATFDPIDLPQRLCSTLREAASKADQQGATTNGTSQA
jgi:hypothetical protein